MSQNENICPRCGKNHMEEALKTLFDEYENPGRKIDENSPRHDIYMECANTAFSMFSNMLDRAYEEGDTYVVSETLRVLTELNSLRNTIENDRRDFADDME